MSMIELNYPSNIAGVQITPLWTYLTAAVHDKNFFVQDSYVYPPIKKPLGMTGVASNDVVSVDIYQGEILYKGPSRGLDGAQRIASVVPVDGTFEYLLPSLQVGPIHLTAVGYDNLNNELVRNRLDFLTTNWAIFLWGFYTIIRQDAPAINRMLNPHLCQSLIGVPDIQAWYLTLTHTPLADWPSTEAGRAVTRGALQALYGDHTSRKAILDHLKAVFGSLPVLQDPDGWVLGGTDYRGSGTTVAVTGASVDVGVDPLFVEVRSDVLRAPVPATDYGYTGTVITLNDVSNIYSGDSPVFELQVLDTTFDIDDWVGVTPYATSFDVDVWQNSDPLFGATLSVFASPTATGGAYWKPVAGDRDATAQNLVAAWNATIAPVYFLTATFLGSPGRIQVSGDVAAAGGADFFKNLTIRKGGSNPTLCMISISESRPLEASAGDIIGVSALGNGEIAESPSLFLGATKTGLRHTLSGTVTEDGDSLPHGAAGSDVAQTLYWLLEAYLVVDSFTGADALLDSDGSLTGYAGHYFLLTSHPILDFVSATKNGSTIVPTVYPPTVVDIGLTTPTLTDAYDISYYRRPFQELRDSVDRAGSILWSPSINLENGLLAGGTRTNRLYTESINILSSSAITMSASGMDEINSVWGRSGSGELLRDVACYATDMYVTGDIFSENQTVSIGRDEVTITTITKIPYVGDRIFFSPPLKEKHYYGEDVYIPDTQVLPTLQVLNVLDFAEPQAQGIEIPVGKSVFLDLVDNMFRDTVRKVYVQVSDSPTSGFSDWTELPYPYRLRRAAIDPMGDPAAIGDEYTPWVQSFGSSAYTISYNAASGDTPPGMFPVGSTRISGASASETDGVQKVFPRGCRIDGSYLSFWCRGSGTQGTCYLDLSRKVPMDAEGAQALEFSVPFTKPGSEWTLVVLDLSSIPATERPDIRTLRFRCPVSGYIDVSGIYGERIHRYYGLKLVVYNSRSRADYILTRLGVRTLIDREHPLWAKDVATPGV